MLLFNAVVLSVLVMLILSVARVHVIISLFIASLVGGLVAGMGVSGTMVAFQDGLAGGAKIALSYALLGAFAMSVAHSGLPRMPKSPLFDECVAYHHCLRQVMEQVLALPLAGSLLARLDQAIGEGAGQLSPLRKLNLLLSGSYRTVALLPNLEAVRRAIPRHQPMPAPQVPPTVTATPSVINTRPGVRLHLCR